MSRFKATGLVLAAIGVVVAALQLAQMIDGGPDLITKAGESLPLRAVEVDTDGSLDRDWLLSYLEVSEDENLLSIDLVAMKERLERIGQVESAEVERRFPDTLVVSVKEREPIARILAQRSNGETLKLFVDTEGFVFEGQQIDANLARSLPFLDGVALRREGQSFSRIEGIGPLAELLSEARTLAPHIYRRWRIVSLEKEDRLIAKGEAAKEVVFDTGADFRQQLGKLDYILDYYRGGRGGVIDHVDLTLGEQVPVRSL